MVVCQSSSLSLSVCVKSKRIWAPEIELDVIFIAQQAAAAAEIETNSINAHGDIHQISLALM